MKTEKQTAVSRKKHYGLIAAIILLSILAALGAAAALIWHFNQWNVQIDLLGGSAVTVEYGERYADEGASAAYKGTILTFLHGDTEVTATDNIDYDKVGTYQITYRAEYKGCTAESTREVTVVDTVSPVITLTTVPDSYTLPGHEYSEEGFTAKDNYDGDITDRVIREERDGKVYYSVTDSSGNEGTAEREIVYDDRTPPVLTLGEVPLEITEGDDWADSYSAIDDCDGDITGQVTIEGAVDNYVAGTYTLRYTITDAHNNTATAERTVTVKPLPKNNPANAVTGSKIIFLTFDDGPGQYTQQLLDILGKYNVKATFFTTSAYPGYAGLMAAEAAAGHTVAVHTYSHNYGTIYANEDAYWADFEQQRAVIQAQTGTAPRIFRFPGGSSNTVSAQYNKGVMTRLTVQAQRKGLEYYDWNVSSGDAGETTDSEQVYRNIISGVQTHDISVVLCHDVKSFTVNAMDKTIRWCLDNGYTFLPLTEGSTVCHHGVNN
ncbi:MAG: polysaccharide deacetylase family protein [Eubacterium sp.]|nr:polysaccharide deacetylase family protein [Eubacterium sp.]